MTGQVVRATKRPVTIEAMQWEGGAEAAGPVIDWVLSNDGIARYRSGPHHPGQAAGETIAVDTLEGFITASPGDWIIRGVKGEFYPCKPDIFAVTYEVEGSTPSDG